VVGPKTVTVVTVGNFHVTPGKFMKKGFYLALPLLIFPQGILFYKYVSRKIYLHPKVEILFIFAS
jgi:hypothetical protein